MKKEIITRSEKETFEVGVDLGRNSSEGDIFALTGELGSGKTVLAKGIAGGLNIEEEITSPTYTLMEIYNGEKDLYHFDLYRIDCIEEFDLFHFEEYWYGKGISVIEWADRAGDKIPHRAIKVNLEYIDSNRRRILIEYPRN